ncbi:MAG: VanZ family protein [Bradyrhizobium sp.]
MTILSRSVAWLLAAAVTFVTLGPPQLRPHTDLGQIGEHTLAFVPIGLAFAFAYPRHRGPAVTIAVVLTGALELLQLVTPGRHARLQDFVVDALATLGGFAIVAALHLATKRARPSNPAPL